MKIVVPGVPIPLARARAGKRGFYDPQYQAKQNFAWEVKKHWKDPPLKEALELTVTLRIPIPKSYSKKKKEQMKDQLHIRRPDGSNYFKFVEDALLGVLWEDDSYIAKGTFIKLWTLEDGSTEILFTTL